MHWVLDCVSYKDSDLLWVNVSLNSQQHLLVGILYSGNSLVPVSITLLDHLLGVLLHLN
jgi:hypothetical protein